MKTVSQIILIFSIAVFISCSQTNKKDKITPDLIKNPNSASSGAKKEKLPELTFKTTIHDFGNIIEGSKVSFSFKFTNTGKADLVISNCIPSCGCTVPDFPKKPIKPGESGYIDVTFDSKGRSGTFNKDVTVYANTIPNSTVIYIKGNITNR
ncbi:MAG TPA: DUF1573 domain-containing protein [Bacteroidia bacterium]|nr:DUF1573 domain-containing protein [Sphingobacteriales bacterium]HPD63933.1 DUF1573 domain-containing protein [Bacteroidia bacterium]HRS57706.1 DUF1573 domain-containing protein [Bacteroidia bacterium]HRU67079.1 DUF1573 domain-containing protein [Bacteroidia bacterium]